MAYSNMNDHTDSIDNHSNETKNEMENDPTLNTRLIFASAWIIIAVAGIIGNTLVIYVAVRFQKMNNVTNCFIVNLAITDIVFLAFCMPLLVVQYTSDHWLFNEIFCKLLNFISYISVLVTVLTLVSMTIDRYIYVVRPFQNLRWRKPQTVFILSIIIWLISCVFASPFYYHYGVTTNDDNYHECGLLSDEGLQKYFRIYTVTLYYFIPLTIILICYTRLLYYVYSKENKLKPKTRHSVIKWSRKRRAVTKMVAIVTLVFSICWLPITLYIMSANIFSRRTAFLYYFKVIGHSFAYLNSAINPILYAFLNRSFRNNCGSLFTKKSCSLVCADDSPPLDINQHKSYTRPSSTQLDRFSYQSTNHQSTVSSQKKKRKKKVSIAKNINRLSPDILSCNDFSDGDCEISDVEYTTRLPTEETTHSTRLSATQHELSSSIDHSNKLNIQTTSL